MVSNRTCSYQGCSNNDKSKKSVKFFRFKKHLIKEWKAACGNRELDDVSVYRILRCHFVCSDHFQNKDYFRVVAPYRDKLRPNAVPVPYKNNEESFFELVTVKNEPLDEDSYENDKTSPKDLQKGSCITNEKLRTKKTIAVQTDSVDNKKVRHYSTPETTTCSSSTEARKLKSFLIIPLKNLNKSQLSLLKDGGLPEKTEPTPQSLVVHENSDVTSASLSEEETDPLLKTLSTPSLPEPNEESSSLPTRFLAPFTDESFSVEDIKFPSQPKIKKNFTLQTKSTDQPVSVESIQTSLQNYLQPVYLPAIQSSPLNTNVSSPAQLQFLPSNSNQPVSVTPIQSSPQSTSQLLSFPQIQSLPQPNNQLLLVLPSPSYVQQNPYVSPVIPVQGSTQPIVNTNYLRKQYPGQIKNLNYVTNPLISLDQVLTNNLNNEDVPSSTQLQSSLPTPLNLIEQDHQTTSNLFQRRLVNSISSVQLKAKKVKEKIKRNAQKNLNPPRRKKVDQSSKVAYRRFNIDEFANKSLPVLGHDLTELCRLKIAKTAKTKSLLQFNPIHKILAAKLFAGVSRKTYRFLRTFLPLPTMTIIYRFLTSYDSDSEIDSE